MKLTQIDAALILRWIIKDIWKIIGLGVIFSVVAVVYALSLPNEYSSSVVTASNMAEGKRSAALGNLGGLASLAGVNIGGSSETYSPEVLQKMLTSTSILSSFAKKNDLVPEVMAIEGYSLQERAFTYNTDIFNPETRTWHRKVAYPASSTPSDSEIAHALRRNLSVTYDRATKLITVGYTSLSPEFSQELVTKLVAHLNNVVREKEVVSANNTIDYIEQTLVKTSSIEVKTALQSILEEQYKTSTLAQTRPDYALMTVEPAALPFEKSGPSRAVICLMIVVGGVGGSVLLLWTVRILRSED